MQPKECSQRNAARRHNLCDERRACATSLCDEEEWRSLERQLKAMKETKLGAESNLTKYTNQQLPREEAQPRWGKRTQAARTTASVPLPIPLRSNSHDVSPHPSSLTNTQQQPADISDERQPFTSSTLTMTGWSRLQPKTAYPTFPSHTQEPAKGPRGAAKTRGKEAQH
ncbi:hypothetical protein QJQ45_029684 [Haematococcus lacustris]|nr:hypothetical protein QJQ45_029684 [Haematococcus lacustris]